MSGALYAVVTRAPGTLITALIYNTDHQTHVNGRTPITLGGFSDSVSAQYQVTRDPFPGGVESLAVSASDEIGSLRFVIAQIKQALNGGVLGLWYATVNPQKLTELAARAVAAVSQSLTSGVDTAVNFLASSYDSGAPTPFFVGPNSTKFTAPRAGKYRIGGTVEFSSAATGLRRLSVRLNGVTTISREDHTLGTTNDFVQLQTNTDYALAATDFVELMAFQTSGAPLTIGAGTYISAAWIRFLGT